MDQSFHISHDRSQMYAVKLKQKAKIEEIAKNYLHD